MPDKIIDQYTDLPVSRQRKHQLRNPEWAKAVQDRYNKSEKGREAQRLYRLRNPDYQRDWQRNKRNSLKGVDKDSNV